MRRHVEEMHTAISLVHPGLNEPQVDEYKTKLIEHPIMPSYHQRSVRTLPRTKARYQADTYLFASSDS